MPYIHKGRAFWDRVAENRKLIKALCLWVVCFWMNGTRHPSTCMRDPRQKKFHSMRWIFNQFPTHRNQIEEAHWYVFISKPDQVYCAWLKKGLLCLYILYWVSKVLVCLYILEKVEIWSGDTDAWLTHRQQKIGLLSFSTVSSLSWVTQLWQIYIMTVYYTIIYIRVGLMA